MFLCFVQQVYIAFSSHYYYTCYLSLNLLSACLAAWLSGRLACWLPSCQPTCLSVRPFACSPYCPICPVRLHVYLFVRLTTARPLFRLSVCLYSNCFDVPLTKYQQDYLLSIGFQRPADHIRSSQEIQMWPQVKTYSKLVSCLTPHSKSSREPQSKTNTTDEILQ